MSPVYGCVSPVYGCVSPVYGCRCAAQAVSGTFVCMELADLITPGVVLAVAVAAWRWLPTKADLAKLRDDVGRLRDDVHGVDKRLAVVEYAVSVTRLTSNPPAADQASD